MTCVILPDRCGQTRETLTLERGGEPSSSSSRGTPPDGWEEWSVTFSLNAWGAKVRAAPLRGRGCSGLCEEAVGDRETILVEIARQRAVLDRLEQERDQTRERLRALEASLGNGTASIPAAASPATSADKVALF
jgi:hypothetical protein